MAYYSEFQVGDTVTFSHKGQAVTCVLSKFNERTVKADQVGDVTIKTKAAFGRPGRTTTVRNGATWKLPIFKLGMVNFRHADPEKRSAANDSALTGLVKAIKEALDSGMDPRDLLMLVAGQVATK